MKRIMFVCKRNSCRSQMAEGFARTLAPAGVEVVSSGLEASRVHPGAIAAMAEVGTTSPARPPTPSRISKLRISTPSFRCVAVG